MFALIGSAALFYHLQNGRQPRDLDLVGTYDEVRDYAKAQGNILQAYPIADGKKYVFKTDRIIIEAEIAWDEAPDHLLHLIKKDPNT